ncbi:MAG: hypothetical protein WC208_15020 [Gallionella sp.]|jgi:hypothetical protein
MKSFPTDIKVHGLRSDKSNPKNNGYAIDARNVRGRKHGLEGYSPEMMEFPSIVYGAGTLSMTLDWPFPQVFQTDTGLFIAKRDGLYQVVFTASVLTATKLTGVYTGSVNWPFTVANCPGFPVFASGDLLVYYDYTTSAWVAFNKATLGSTAGTHWDTTWDQPVSACFFNGQVIVCGGTSSTTWPSNSRLVRWSEVGAFKFLGKTATAISNVAGQVFAPCDDNEILLRCMKLGRRVIVYGTFSCFVMRPIEDPVPAFGIKKLDGIVGMRNPLAVAGNETKQLIVDREGDIRLITYDVYENVNVELVGHSEYLGNAQKNLNMSTGEDIVIVTYNEQEDEFYISNGIESFLFREGELTRINKCITSMVNYKNAAVTDSSDFAYINKMPIGVYSDCDDEVALYQSDAIDLSMNAIKTIETVELTGTLPAGANAEVMIETRVNRTEAFRSTKWVRINPSGIASPIVSGVEMRVNVRVSKLTGLTLESLRLWWKLSDKRGIRGNYASTSNA